MAGGVTRRPNGKWIARFRGPDRRERSKTFDTKRDALAWRGEQIASMRTGNWIDPTGASNSFSKCARVWVENKRATNLRPSTFQSYLEILNNRVAPKWGNYSLALISVDEINTWTRSLVEEGLSPSRINKCLLVVRQVLDVAVSSRLIGYNVMESGQIIKPKGRRPKPAAFTLDEVFLLVNEMPDEYKLLTEFLCFTGLRMSEVVALQVGDVDIEKATVKVERSTVSVRGEYYDGPPKSGKSRTVPLITSLAIKIREHIASKKKKDWLFSGKTGKQLLAEDYRTVYRRRVARIGRPELTPHSCRDTFASLSVSAGVPVTSIAQSLGHADPSITLRVYSSFYDSDFDKLRKLLDAEVSKAEKGFGKEVNQPSN